MLKVTKFGGSSMADAGQYQKIRDILAADPARQVVIVSAAGKAEKAVQMILMNLWRQSMTVWLSWAAAFW